MNVPICRHIKSNGLQCRGVALNSSVFCYFHARLHRSHDLYRDKVYLQPGMMRHDPFLKLPAMEDRESIQIAISSVINALATGCIDEKRAYALSKLLYLASYNARGLRPVPRPKHMVRDIYKEPWIDIPEANPDIAPPGLTVEIEDPKDPTPEALTELLAEVVTEPPTDMDVVILNAVKDPCIPSQAPPAPHGSSHPTTNIQQPTTTPQPATDYLQPATFPTTNIPGSTDRSSAPAPPLSRETPRRLHSASGTSCSRRSHGSVHPSAAPPFPSRERTGGSPS
jgi:hypothetical protein